MKLQCTHEIPLSAETFWQIIHDPRYEELASEAQNLAEYTTTRKWEEDDAICRSIRVVPPIPKQMESLLNKLTKNPSNVYTENQRRLKDRMAVEWETIPGFLSEKISIKGVLRIEPVDESSCRRILEGDVKVSIMGLGKLVEKAIIQGTIDAYDQSAAAVASFKEKYPEG